MELRNLSVSQEGSLVLTSALFIEKNTQSGLFALFLACVHVFSRNYLTFLNLEQASAIQLLNLELLQIIWQERSERVLVEFPHTFFRMMKDILTMFLIIYIHMQNVLCENVHMLAVAY